MALGGGGHDSPGRIRGMVDPRLEAFDQGGDESRLVVEARQEGEVDVNPSAGPRGRR